LALPVPLSQFTPRVGGGSAFYVSHHRHAAMKKSIVSIIGVVLLAILCLFWHHNSYRRAFAPKFLRYEADTNDGIVRAVFIVTNRSSSDVLCTPRAVPNISMPGWRGTTIDTLPHGSSEFGLAVYSWSTSWQLTLDYWQVKAHPDSWNELKKAVAGKPSFTLKSSMIISNLPVK
jgi:hypothetical protein